MANEAYNLERAIAEEKMVDPTGKRWEIKGERENGLVHARPDPDRKDAVIPEEFQGRWTSAALLKTKIQNWLKKQWDMSEAVAMKNARKTQAAAESKAKQKTAEESLSELPDEIRESLGDILATAEAEDKETPKVSKKKVSKKKATGKK